MFEFMTMVEIFIATFVLATILGIALGFLTYWIFEKDNKEEND